MSKVKVKIILVKRKAELKGSKIVTIMIGKTV